MSQLIIKLLGADNKVRAHKILDNAHMGAPIIWQEMSKTYLGDGVAYYGDQDKLWALARDPKVAHEHQLVLASTYDWCIVECERSAELAKMYREFQRATPLGARSHLGNIAFQLETMPLEAKGMCFRWTSVSQDPWTVVESDNERPYDTTKDTKHWFLFQRYGTPATTQSQSPQSA